MAAGQEGKDGLDVRVRPRRAAGSVRIHRCPGSVPLKMRSLFPAWVLAVSAALAFVVPVARAAEFSQPIAVAVASVSMEQAVKMAEQRFRAKVVRAETQHNDGRTVYVLRMLNESGHVWTVRVDASNGAVL